MHSAVLSPDLVALAGRQRGVFTATQAYELGYRPREIQWLRSVHALISVRRGVYAEAKYWSALSSADSYLAELLALSLVLVEPAVISHASAGAVHAMSLLPSDLRLLHITRPDRGGSRVEAGVHHHVADLPPRDVLDQGPWLVTSLARTAVDIARQSELPAAVAAMDSALRQGAGRQDMLDVLLACINWPGARTAGLALRLADGRAANAGESWSRVELIRQGVAPTDIQRKLYDGDGLVGIADFIWEPERVVGELDGRLKYRVAPGSNAETAGDTVWAEKRREDRIRDLGYEVVRWVYTDLLHPERLAARVRQALGRGAARRTA